MKHLVVCDRAGAIYRYRPERMNWAKAYVAKETNQEQRRGSLKAMLKGADVFVGLSTGNIVTDDMIRDMAHDPIVFALAVPTPEIEPAAARAGGAKVVATGRSDYPNTMDISLVFPGVFRGLLDCRARNIRLRTLLYAANALADMVRAGRAPRRLHRPPSVRLPGCASDRGGGGPRRGRGAAKRDLKSLPPTSRKRRALRLRRPPRPPMPSTRDEHKTFKEEAIELRRAPRRRARNSEQDPDSRSPHPEHALCSAGGARARRTSFAKTRPRCPS